MVQLVVKPELVIGGEHREASDGATFDVRNPATTSMLAKVPHATEDDVRATIDEAEDSFEKWSEKPDPERAEILYRTGEIIRREQNRAC